MSYEHLRRKYQALLEGAPDAVLVADRQSGEIVEANRTAATLFETSVEELVGRHQSELHPPEKLEDYRVLFERHKEMAEGGEATRSRLRDGSPIYVVTDNGRHVPVEISASFVDLNGEELFVGIFRDITARRERERRLEEAKNRAEEASRLKSAMLANMSHEVRTPATSIIGFSKVLANALDGELADYAENIHRAAQHLTKTIDSVLQLSKLEANVQDFDRERARLDQAAEWAFELLELRAQEKGVDLRKALPDAPVAGRWNQEALNHIAENLLENAIKFTPEGGRVEVWVRRESEAAVLEVEDTGIGMDPARVPELFEGFRQASEGLSREYEGVGLGLPIVKQLTEALGGTLDIDTEKGTGTCVTVHFPLSADAG